MNTIFTWFCYKTSVLLFVAGILLASQSPPNDFSRDDYGVPHISCPSRDAAWRAAGFAVAQDRLWQMEMSRRTVRGRIAEVIGSNGVASDREVLKTAYTDEELQAQFDALSPTIRSSFTDYAQGVNDFIALGNLPPEYAKAGLTPEPWTVLDSSAISVWLLQYFGRGGAGALRNMAALAYLQSRKPLQGRVLDVMDDFIWQNDPSSPTTISKEDESPIHPIFVPPTRQISEKTLALLPKLSLFELLPGLSVAMREKSTQLAERVSAPFRTGSYCMVVGPKRSATGLPLLLSGPQMGFTVPSIVHEMSIDTPGLHVAGMDVPGIPGVLIGQTEQLAWGITSGVADTDDIVFAPRSGPDDYKSGAHTLPLRRHTFILKVKGEPDQTVVQERTEDGPVLFSTAAHGAQPGYLFARHASYRNKELVSLASIEGLWTARTVKEADEAASQSSMSFNVFFADREGSIGFRYGGYMPIRTTALDPRFPVPEEPQFAWKGRIPADQMPHVLNPKAGLLTNWNNKPVSWWPNLDTPIWGKIFHVDAIRRSLPDEPLSAQDLELAAWKIARTDETWPYFAPYVNQAMRELKAQVDLGGFDGKLFQGSRQAVVYRGFLTHLRQSLFLPTVGNFLSESLAAQIAQPSVMLAALQGHTHFDYLQGRKATDIVRAALKLAIDDEKSAHSTFQASQIRIPDEAPVPYANRGTYIQVIEMLEDGPLGRNVMPPGVAASGPHSRDQVPLSRAWIYKPMLRPWKT
jgi:penicillin amidase